MINKWFQNLFKKKQDGKKKTGSIQYLFIILGIGVVLMLFGNFFSSDPPDQQQALTASSENQNEDTQDVLGRKDSSDPSSVTEYEHYYENKLKEALEDGYGISDIIVKVTVSTSKRKILGEDRTVDSETTKETDKQGGTRTIEKNSSESKVVMKNNGQGDEPVIVGVEQPKVSGVTVTAGGADHAQVEKWIMEAAHSLFGVPEYRITVIPKTKKGE